MLRLLTVLVLAVWVGGLVALGAAAAPAIFDATADLENGRTVAGRLVEVVLGRFFQGAWGLAATLAALLGLRAAVGPRPRPFAVRLWLVLLMLLATATTQWYVAPAIREIRDSVAGPVAGLPAGDARVATFGRLHGLSNGLMLLTVLSGTALLWLETRDVSERARP